MAGELDALNQIENHIYSQDAPVPSDVGMPVTDKNYPSVMLTERWALMSIDDWAKIKTFLFYILMSEGCFCRDLPKGHKCIGCQVREFTNASPG